jgi:RimJ/RimL family protein N-acetyltransferase
LNGAVFTPVRTERLLLRPFRRADVAGLVARRNDPAVARYQDWTLPYPQERAESMVGEFAEMDGPANDAWWMLLIADPVTDAPIGDLALHLTSEGRTAEIGYTLASEHWGNGYATEAVAALVAYLFEDLGVTRVFGMLHPDNVASALVLERTGFLFEGHTRLSFWLGDDNSDDHIYGLTREDWEAWRCRPRHVPERLRLIELTVDNNPDVWRLQTHKSQEAFVATMPESFADALFPEVVDGHPLVPWMRGVEADGEMVGFVMLALPTERHREPYLWRLLVDRLHQRRGIGGRTLDLVEAECRAMGGETLLTSWAEGRGSPRPFYLARGFEPTGRIVDDETEARKRLD